MLSILIQLRNARISSSVLLVFSWNDIDVIKKLHLCPFRWHSYNFLIKKITFMSFQDNTIITQKDAQAFLCPIIPKNFAKLD
jgi:hypothetical protein